MEHDFQSKDQITVIESRNSELTGETTDAAPTTFSENDFTHQTSQYATGDPEATTMNLSSLTNALPSYAYSGAHQTYPPSGTPGPNAPPVYQYGTTHYSGTISGQTVPFSQQIPIHFQGQRLYGSYQTGPNMPNPQYANAMYIANQQMISGGVPVHFQTFQQSPAYSHTSDNYYSRMGQYQQLHGYNNMATSERGYPSHDVSDLQQLPPLSSTVSPTALRGPPRKPKQSGHALWVGNLPPGANIIDLKDHFARDATNEIESVFLISKSNCAFVNYKSEEGCASAMSRFHDSRFQGVRLVCRLRRGATIGSSVTSANGLIETLEPSQSIAQIDVENTDAANTEQQSQAKEEMAVGGNKKIKERFFIIKSLTTEDLERSVHTGIWATQSHNEMALNKAYETAENVYLVFSANKSGEYFGYARMDSAIDDESAAQIANEIPTPKDISPGLSRRNTSPSTLPMTIPTAATATAPRGYIIDDSARGTIFWEAESSNPVNDDSEAPTPTEQNDEMDQQAKSGQSPSSVSPSPDVTSAQTTFGKPFRICWQSTDRLPFYRTRGLRNPWNTNREVKIARDGTEIEPMIGRKLVDMFGAQSPAQARGQAPYSGPLIVGPGFGPGGQMYGRGY